jgi:hypothetical protein
MVNAKQKQRNLGIGKGFQRRDRRPNTRYRTLLMFIVQSKHKSQALFVENPKAITEGNHVEMLANF